MGYPMPKKRFAMDDISSLFKEQINWQCVKLGRSKFYASVDGERCELRMNDFPEEPLYTLTFRGQSIDFDDRPKTWTLPLNEELIVSLLSVDG
jgi:hypothetical protein